MYLPGSCKYNAVFSTVTVKEHDKFIVIQTAQLSAFLHTVVTEALMVVTSSRTRGIFTKTTNIRALPKREVPIIPSETTDFKRPVTCSLRGWTTLSTRLIIMLL